MSVNDATLNRLKGAQRDLISSCGGIDRAARIASVSSSAMGRYNTHTQPDLMSLGVVLALEAECGEPWVTQALAGLQGRRLSDPEADRAVSQDLTGSFAAQLAKSAAVMQQHADMFADGVATPAELNEARRLGGELMGAVSNYLGAIASAQAMGGVKANLKLVSEG